MLECQELKEKVKESRYIKVGARHINKFKRLLQRKYNLVKHPQPPSLGNSAGPVSTPSQLGGNVGRAGAQPQAGSVSPKAGSARPPS